MSDLGTFALGSTIYDHFTTAAASTGAPTVLSGSPVVSVYEDANDTQITAGVTLGVDADGVVGLNRLTIVATAANGYEVGKQYFAVITTGTVGGTSAVGYKVSTFDISKQGYTSANGVVASGTAQSATATTIVLASGESFANDTANGMTVLAFGATQGYWQSRIITDYDLATDTATVDTWTVTPSGTITYVVIGTPPVPASLTTTITGNATSANVSTSVSTAQSAALSSATVAPSAVMSVAASSGGIDANVQKINDVTVLGAGTAGNKWRA